MGTVELLILAGALAGGFVNGLTGFGTGLTALPFWLNAVAPTLAAPLVVVCSLIGQVQTLPAIWGAIVWRQVLPFIVGGVLGVPFGTLLLELVSVEDFKLMVGCILIVYCSVMLMKRDTPTTSKGGRLADGIVGLIGGVFGGLAGLSGVAPTLWSSLKTWGKDEKRSIFQAFNFSILVFSLVSQGVGGYLTWELGRLALIALPATLVGVWLGRKTYNKLGDRQYNKIVLILLLLSGISIVVTTVL